MQNLGQSQKLFSHSLVPLLLLWAICAPSCITAWGQGIKQSSNNAGDNTAGAADKSSAKGDDSVNANGDKDAAKKSTWDGSPFYKGVVTRDGRKFQHWSFFPRKNNLVYLGFVGDKGPERVGLSGDIYIPASAKVCLYIREELLDNPNYMKGLNGCNVDEVDLQWARWIEIEPAIPVIAKCKSIKGLKIGDIYWVMDDSRACTKAINQFPNLEKLALRTAFEGKSLAKISRVGLLKELHLDGRQPYLHSCLQVISGSKNLLCFGADDWRLPSADLELLAKCLNLHQLTVGRLTGSHDQIAILAKLPALQYLHMPALRYRPDLTTDLKGLRSLRTLKVLVSEHWTSEQMRQLKRDLPNVQVQVYQLIGKTEKEILTQ